MTRDRDVQAFADRAPGYERGYLGRLHREIVVRSADLALMWFGSPSRVLDVGCGTGLLVRELARRLPDATRLTGIDAAAAMVEQARLRASEAAAGGGLAFEQGTAERLPFADGAFDLVISTTSFDHWTDQAAGLAECHRVLAAGGHILLTDLFSAWLLPTLVGARRDRARTPLRATRLLAAAGFRSIGWHRHYGMIIRSVTATA